MIGTVVALSTIALSGDLPLTYLVFPALIWAALRFGQQGASLALAIAAGTAVGITANEVGAFVQHSITEAALATQLYIAVAALTTLCLVAIISERRRAALEVADSRARIAVAGARERRRLAAELHDSAQNRVVALQVRLELAREQAAPTAPELAAQLEPLVLEAGAVNEDLRRIAHGVLPRHLTSQGLAGALRAAGEHSAVALHIAAGDLDRSEPDIELAVYLCCLESIQNAAKHAGRDANDRAATRRECAGVQHSRHRARLRPNGEATGRGPHEYPRPHRHRRRARRDHHCAWPRHDRGRRRPMAPRRLVARARAPALPAASALLAGQNRLGTQAGIAVNSDEAVARDENEEPSGPHW